MKFFKKILENVDIAELRREVSSNESLWLANTNRQDKISVQRDTNTIFLRGALYDPGVHVNNNQISRFTRLASQFPAAIQFLVGFANANSAELSRATIVRLKPRSKVYPHVDEGTYYFIRDRYHLVIKSDNGSTLRCGDEEAVMREAELWWFNNKHFHEAANASDQWRIHFIFDLLPLKYRELAFNPVRLSVAEHQPPSVPESAAAH